MKKLLYWSLSSVILASTLLLTISNELRGFIVNDLLDGDKRKVLSVITVKNDKTEFKFIKIRKGKNIFIEIYSDKRNEIFDLGRATNGTLFLSGKSTELASVDLDDDGLIEVIVPALNSQFKSELYILNYNVKTKRHSMSNSVPYLNLNN